MVTGLLGTGPGCEDLAPRAGAFGKETPRFPHSVPGVESAGCREEGRAVPFFFVIFPLGRVTDAAGSLGVVKPILHMQSKVTLIYLSILSS